MDYLELEHLSLGQLISELEKRPEETHVPLGFCRPHSYRGYYERLGFIPENDTTVGAMLACARQALGNTYCGYKGGEWKMDEDTLVYLAYWGNTGEEMGRVLLYLMIGPEA